jgi:uncharacterized protein with PIN domain
VDKAVVLERLPPKVRELYDRFRHCPGCDRVYWEGTHYQRMRGLMESDPINQGQLK